MIDPETPTRKSKKSVYLRHDKGLAGWLYLEKELGIQPLLNAFFFSLTDSKAEGCSSRYKCSLQDFLLNHFTMKETLRISLKLHIEVSTQKVVKVKAYKRVANGKIVKVRSHYRTIEG